jgi:hypothetical protein
MNSSVIVDSDTTGNEWRHKQKKRNSHQDFKFFLPIQFLVAGATLNSLSPFSAKLHFGPGQQSRYTTHHATFEHDTTWFSNLPVILVWLG